MKKFIGILLALYLLTFLFGADQVNFPDIYIDESVAPGGVGSLADPYSDFSEINWTTGGDNSIFDWYAGAEDASVTINLQEGEEWREELIVGTDGSATYPIIIRSYGSGATPIINATNITTGWVADQSWQTTWSTNVDQDSSAGEDMNIRILLPAADTTTSGTSIRITLRGHSTNAGQIDGASIGLQDGVNEENFDGAPIVITWVDNGVTIPIGGELVSDAIVFAFTHTNDYNIHLWLDDGGVDYKNTLVNGPGGGQYDLYDSDVEDTATQDITARGYTDHSSSGRVYAMSEVEVLTGTANVWTKTGITSQPYIVIFDGTIGTYQTSKGNLSSEYDWFWDTGPDELYVYAPGDPDTEYTIVEVATRARCIQITGDKDYITVQDLKLYGAREAAVANFDDCDYITVKDSEIVAMGRFGIIFGEATNILFQNLHVHDITVEEAFYFDASSENGTNNVTLEYCNIHDFAENGIYLGTSTGDGLQDIIIRYNRIVDSVDTWNTGTLSAGGGGDGYGIQGKNTDGLDIYYNYMSETDRGGFDLVLGVSNVNIYNNTIYGSTTHYLARFGGDVINIKNNIFQTDSDNEPLFYILTGATNVTISNNQYYTTGNGTDAFHWLGTDYTYAQFANWEVASGDTNSATGDPLFIDAANDDFRLLMASPCINAGTDVGLTTDYRGRSIRHAPDIGAYEDPTNAVFMSAEFFSFGDLWLLFNKKPMGLIWWEEINAYIKEKK